MFAVAIHGYKWGPTNCIGGELLISYLVEMLPVVIMKNLPTETMMEVFTFPSK